MRRLFWLGLFMSTSAFCWEEAAFLKIPGSAREAALAKAITSISFDLTAIHSNPAALGEIGNMGLTSTYSKWFEDMAYTNFAFGFRPKKSFNSFAVSMIGLGVSDIEKRNEDGELEGTFGAQDYSFGFSYARGGKTISEEGDTLVSFYSYGITIKYLRETIDEDVAQGYCMDAGFLYKTPIEIKYATPAIPNYLGFAVTSLGPGLQEKSSAVGTRQSFHPPMRASGGLGYEFTFTPMIKSIIALDAIISLTGGYNEVALGTETDINRMFFMRLGFANSIRGSGDLGQTSKLNYGIGCGFKVGDFSIDYVYSLRYLDNTHAFSASLEF